jgi:hypothetical protein
MFGNGLQIKYKYARTPHPQSNKMVAVELTFINVSNGDLNSLAMSNKRLQAGMAMSNFDEFDLAREATRTVLLGIDFGDTTQPVTFELSAVYSNDPLLGGTSNTRKWPNLSITCPIGELVQPGWSISENEFNKLQAGLKGMNEMSVVVDELTHAQFMAKDLNRRLLDAVNMCQIPSSHQETIKYTGLTSSSKMPLLVSLFFASGTGKCHVNVNCEKIVLANMFIKEVKQLLTGN